MIADLETRYVQKVVSYVDILGFRDLVLKSHDVAGKSIRRLDDAIKHSLECLKLDAGADWFSIKLFSDCFCLSCREQDLITLLAELAFLQWSLACGGMFVRGAVSIGRHFENTRIIFSEGLIRAYELQQPDPYPRISIDPAVVQTINQRSAYAKGELMNYVLKGHDNVFFLDYLSYSGYEGGVDHEDILEAHKQAILEQVAVNASRPAIIAKYRWVAEYHNFKFGEFFNEEDYIEGYFDTLRERLWIPTSLFPSFTRPDHA